MLPFDPNASHSTIRLLARPPLVRREGTVARLVAIWANWSDRARQRRRLSALDDRLLRDIGITREQALRESAKPFWR